MFLMRTSAFNHNSHTDKNISDIFLIHYTVSIGHNLYKIKSGYRLDQKFLQRKRGVLPLEYLSVDQSEMDQGFFDAVVIDIGCDIIGCRFSYFFSVAHRYADSDIFQHFRIIFTITESH